MKQLLALSVFLFCSTVFGQRYVATYQTVSDAYSANLNNSNTNIFILGRSSANDGGGGLFYYDKNSTTTTNLGTVFGNAYGGRVKRIHPSGYVETAWFGANGTPASDSTAAIQNAIDTVVYGRVQLSGTNTVSNLNIKRGITLSGHHKWNTCLKALSGATGWMISIDELSGAQLDTEFNVVPVVLEDFSMEGNNRVSDIGGLYLNHVDYVVARNLNIWRFQRSGVYLNTSVRESLFDDVSVRFCAKRDATNNNGQGWPAVSFVDWEPSSASTEDKLNGIKLINSEIVFSLGDALAIDTKQMSSGRKVNNISVQNCWIHGWSDAFYTVEFANTLTNSATLRQYDLVKVGAAYDVRFLNNRFSFTGQGKPALSLTTSTLGGSPVSGLTYTPEKVQVSGNFFNHRYSSTLSATDIGIKADAGSGIITDNISEGLTALQDTTTGWRSTLPIDSTVEGISFDPNISGSYASGAMQSVGTSPFTIHVKVRLPNAIPATAGGLLSLGSAAGTISTPGFAIYLSSNGNLYPVMYGATSSDRRIATIPQTVTENFLGQIVDLVFTRSGSTFKVYVNGGEFAYVEEVTGTPPNWSDSLGSTKWNLGASIGTPWPSTIHEFRVANRALSATEVMGISRGTVPADMWGSTAAINSGLLTIGYKYRITARSISDFTTVGASANTVGTEFTATGTGSGLLDASNTVTRIGWIVDTDLIGNTGTTVYDRSTNDGDGSLVGNGVKWIKTVGSAPAVVSSSGSAIDQPDRGYSWDGIQSGSYIGGLSQQLGTDPYTIHVRVRYPSSNPTNSAGIYTLTTSAGTIAVQGCGLVLQSNGALQFIQYAATGSDFRIANVAASQLTSYAGIPVDITVVRNGATLAIYANGTALTYTEITGGTAPAWSQSLTTDRYNIGLFTGSQVWVSTISSFRVSNRALSASEVALMNKGALPADVWGSTTILNSGTLTIGKRYRIVARATSDFTTAGSANNTVGTEFVATTTGSGLLDASNTVRRIGWFLDVDLGNNAAGSVKDRTSNALDGTLAGAGVVQVPADPAAVSITAGDSPTWTGAHVFSKNGALNLPTVSVTGTPITGGTATTTKPLMLIETSGTSSTTWSTSGTMLGVNAPSGFAGKPIDVQVNGSSSMNLSAGGSLTIAASLFAGGGLTAGSAQNIGWSAFSVMKSPSDGIIGLYNNAGSAFTRLQLGGTTTSFPALGRSSTTIAVQLADGTAGGKLSVGTTQSKVGGTIDQKFSSTGTPASSVETDLYTYTAVASALGTDGDGFTLMGGGTFAGNASATSQLRVYFGGTQIFASGALTASSSGSWRIDTFVIRDSSTSVRAITTLTTANAITTPITTQTDVTGLTLSNTQIIKITGQGGGASPAVNDTVCKLGRVRFEPVF